MGILASKASFATVPLWMTGESLTRCKHGVTKNSGRWTTPSRLASGSDGCQALRGRTMTRRGSARYLLLPLPCAVVGDWPSLMGSGRAGKELGSVPFPWQSAVRVNWWAELDLAHFHSQGSADGGGRPPHARREKGAAGFL